MSDYVLECLYGFLFEREMKYVLTTRTFSKLMQCNLNNFMRHFGVNDQSIIYKKENVIIKTGIFI